jgi:DNA-binding MarR family transcriptional regulator
LVRGSDRLSQHSILRAIALDGGRGLVPISVHMHASPSATIALPPAGSCTCTKVRGLARRLTGLYDVALSAHGLTVTQYAALATLARAADVLPIADLARRLQMDRTTTTRLVAPLLAAGLLARLDGRKTRGDGRARPLQLTPKGRRRLASAIPAWRRAQHEVGKLLGARLREMLERTADEADRALLAACLEPAAAA